MDVGTWFFQKESHPPMQYPMFSIGISSYDKLNVITKHKSFLYTLKELILGKRKFGGFGSFVKIFLY